MRVEPQEKKIGIAFAITSHCFDQTARWLRRKRE